MKFEVVGQDECFYFLKAFENNYLIGVFRIVKNHFYSCDAIHFDEYCRDLEKYVEMNYKLLIEDSILIEIECF